MGEGGASHGATEIELTAVIHSLAMNLIIEAPRKVGEVRKSGRRQVKQREGVGKSGGEIWKKKASPDLPPSEIPAWHCGRDHS
jgi:hypothetical protein